MVSKEQLTCQFHSNVTSTARFDLSHNSSLLNKFVLFSSYNIIKLNYTIRLYLVLAFRYNNSESVIVFTILMFDWLFLWTVIIVVFEL